MFPSRRFPRSLPVFPSLPVSLLNNTSFSFICLVETDLRSHITLLTIIGKLEQRRRQRQRRQRKRHLKICIPFYTCATSPWVKRTLSTGTRTTNYPGTKLVGVAFKLRKRMKNSPSCAHVLHKTLNLVISSRCRFAEQGRQRKEPKCKTRLQVDCISSLNLLVFFAALSLPSPLLKLPIVHLPRVVFSRKETINTNRNQNNYFRHCYPFSRSLLLSLPFLQHGLNNLTAANAPAIAFL